MFSNLGESMARIERNFVQFGFYHVFNRGNHKLPVFRKQFDYQYFLGLVDRNAQKYGVEIIAYCLMRNHYHFLLQQRSDDEWAITKTISCSVMSYSHYFNATYGKVGHVFQDKFKSKPVLSDEYLLHLTKYIHNNPAEFTNPIYYQWSSIGSYLSGRRGIANPRYVLKYLGRRPYELDEVGLSLSQPSPTSESADASV
jgi:putative transposase